MAAPPGVANAAGVRQRLMRDVSGVICGRGQGGRWISGAAVALLSDARTREDLRNSPRRKPQEQPTYHLVVVCQVLSPASGCSLARTGVYQPRGPAFAALHHRVGLSTDLKPRSTCSRVSTSASVVQSHSLVHRPTSPPRAKRMSHRGLRL